MIFHRWDKYRDYGILLLRVGLGLLMMWHGWPKLTAGPEMWAKLGGNMKYLGLDFAPTFWGFMAMFAEFFGGLLLVLGLFFRPAAFLLAFTMLIAILTHAGNMDKEPPRADAPPKTLLQEINHPLELGVVFLSLLLIGPGRISIDDSWDRSRRK